MTGYVTQLYAMADREPQQGAWPTLPGRPLVHARGRRQAVIAASRIQGLKLAGRANALGPPG